MTRLQLEQLSLCCTKILRDTSILKVLAVCEEEQLTNEMCDYVNLQVLRENIRVIRNAVDNIVDQYDLEDIE